MPHKRSAVLLALATFLWSASWGQDPSTRPNNPPVPADPAAQNKNEPEAPPTEAEKAIDAAVEKLKALDTYAADVRVEADMLGQVFQIVGQVARKAGNRLLLRLSIEGLGDASGLLQRTCDGTVLWEYLRILDNPSLRSVQLAPLLKALDKPEADQEFRDRVMMQLGFSGPEALLAGLRKAGRFDQMADETLDGRQVWVIRGLWKDREAMGLPNAQNVVDQAGFLPPYIPSYVAMWIDQETGWPHKILMQGKVQQRLREEPKLDATGRSISRKNTQTDVAPSSVTLNYSKSDRPVTDEEFLFQPPPNVNAIDETERRTLDIENALIDFATRKRAEATSKSGDVLEQSLPAPAPNPGAAPARKPGPDAVADTPAEK